MSAPIKGQWDDKLRAWKKQFKISVWQDRQGLWIVSQSNNSTHFCPRETDAIKTLKLLAHTAQTKKGGDWVSKAFGRNCMMELLKIFNLKIYDERYVP